MNNNCLSKKKKKKTVWVRVNGIVKLCSNSGLPCLIVFWTNASGKD